MLPDHIRELINNIFLPEKVLLLRRTDDLFEQIDHLGYIDHIMIMADSFSFNGNDWLAVEIDQIYRENLINILRLHAIHINTDDDVPLTFLIDLLSATLAITNYDESGEIKAILEDPSSDTREVLLEIIKLVSGIAEFDFLTYVERVDQDLLDNIKGLVETGDWDYSFDPDNERHAIVAERLQQALVKLSADGYEHSDYIGEYFFSRPKLNVDLEFILELLKRQITKSLDGDLQATAADLLLLVTSSNVEDDKILEVTRATFEQIADNEAQAFELNNYLKRLI